MPSSRRWPILASLLLGACAGMRGEYLRQHLDERTALTLTGLDAPLVLYRDEPQLSANARDYLQLGPLEINRQGELRYYLWVSLWSTIEREDAAARRRAFERVYLFADGEPMDLALTAWNLSGKRADLQFYDKPVESAVDAFYGVTVDQLRRIAAAREIYLLAGAGQEERYEAWEWRPDALAAFVGYAADRELR
jgi:hypothetical protein